MNCVVSLDLKLTPNRSENACRELHLVKGAFPRVQWFPTWGSKGSQGKSEGSQRDKGGKQYTKRYIFSL